MKEFRCTKCNSSDVFISKSGNNVGLYCGDCGRWITWLNKNQLRLVEKQIANKRGDVLKELLEKLSESSIDEVNAVCESVGVKTKDDKGNYRTVYDVLTDLSKAFYY